MQDEKAQNCLQRLCLCGAERFPGPRCRLLAARAVGIMALPLCTSDVGLAAGELVFVCLETVVGRRRFLADQT